MKFRHLVGCMVLAVLASQAEAGRDVASDEGDNYQFDGQMWNPDVVTPRTGVVPFALDFGLGAVTNRAFTLDTHGQVTFAGSDFFAPLLAPTAYGPDSGISYTTGLLDRSVVNGTTTSTFDKANGYQAIRFYWNFVCPSGQSSCGGSQFQAVLVNLDAEHFVLEFNYNDFNPTITGGSAGYHLGANLGSFSGPYSDVGPDYCFDHGVARAFSSISACVATTSSTVPEPAPLALVAAGLLAMGYATRRGIVRRRSLSARRLSPSRIR